MSPDPAQQVIAEKVADRYFLIADRDDIALDRGDLVDRYDKGPVDTDKILGGQLFEQRRQGHQCFDYLAGSM